MEAEEVDHTGVDGSDEEEEQPDQSPDRRHVDALLDVSEEDFMRDLEPHEYHCYSGWEEAVQGWARVAPLSCILLTQKRYRKLKHKEADHPAPVDPAVPCSASPAEHLCESHVDRHNSFKKSINQHTGSWSHTAVAALQASEWPVLNAMHKTTLNVLLEDKMEEEGTIRGTPLQNRPTKPQKHSHRHNNMVVPIKNFTFLPPIKSEGETIEDNCFMFDKKSGTRGTRGDPVANPELPTYSAALTSKYRTCQHNPHLFSAVSVSIPKRYQVSSKRDTAYHTSFSVGKSLTQALQSGTAAGARARARPNKTVCAVKLYEGCEINV